VWVRPGQLLTAHFQYCTPAVFFFSLLKSTIITYDKLWYCWYSTSSFLDYRNHQSALINLLFNDNFRHFFFLS
jgi:hypothetical protein